MREKKVFNGNFTEVTFILSHVSFLLKKSFSIHPIKVALVYRSPNSTVTTFIEELSWLGTIKKLDVLLEDAYASVCNILSIN